MPRSLDFHPKLPRMDNGKLYKRHLVEEYRGAARTDEGPGPSEDDEERQAGDGSAG
jgi:fatty-acyl-CoA synthase